MVLVDGLGAILDRVFAQFAGKNESDGGLDLHRSEGPLVVHSHQPNRLVGNTVEEIVRETVETLHRLTRDAAAWEKGIGIGNSIGICRICRIGNSIRIRRH